MCNGGLAANCDHRALRAGAVLQAGPDLTAAPVTWTLPCRLGEQAPRGRSVRAQGSWPESSLEAVLSPKRPCGRPGCCVGSGRQEIWLLDSKKALIVRGFRPLLSGVCPAPHAQAVPERGSREVRARPGRGWSWPPCPGSQQQMQ